MSNFTKNTNNVSTNLFFKIAILYCQQALCKENLQFFDKEVLGVVDANKRANYIARFVRPEICMNVMLV